MTGLCVCLLDCLFDSLSVCLLVLFAWFVCLFVALCVGVWEKNTKCCIVQLAFNVNI